MGRVRKDILNGWKEIGGYVCRDIRTVERWEKQRGLPVRRVPGTGRATVYALISEVDEWLASAKLDDIEEAAEVETAPFAAAEEIVAAPVEMEVLAEAQEIVPTQTQPSQPVSIAAPLRIPLRTMAVGVGMATLVALVFAVVWPWMVQARRETNLTVQSVPYRSKVAGVDDLYLSGQYFGEQRTPDSLRHALDNFNAAITKDPNYAPAYVGLANTYNLMREYAAMPDAEAYRDAKVAAERGMLLDPKLPQAHASLGFVDFFWAWDAVAAEKEFQTALTLDPSSVLAHHWYGSMLTHEGRYAEAIEQLDIAQRLQPTSAAILSLRALASGLSGHRDEAVVRLEEIVKDAPSATSPHNVLRILSLVEPRDLPRYLSEERRVAELRHEQNRIEMSAVGERAYRAGGEKAMWSALLAYEKHAHPDTWNRFYPMADAEAALGNSDEAFAILYRVADAHDTAIMGIYTDPVLRVLRSDPRFAELAKKIGLPALPPG